MGYFDALTSSSFKTTPDGRRLFHPWGIWGRGYAIPSEAHYQRLQRQIKTYVIVVLAVMIVGVALLPAVWVFVIAAVLIGLYFAWTPFLLRGLTRTDETLSWRESMTTQARLHHAWVLWLLLIVALAFVALGFVILLADPDEWLIAVSSIVLFGPCAGIFAYMLRARQRAAAAERP
jgi:hypothetical protein